MNIRKVGERGYFNPHPLINALKGGRHLNALVHFRCVIHGFFVCLVTIFIVCLVPGFIVCLVSSFRYNGLAMLALAGPSGPCAGKHAFCRECVKEVRRLECPVCRDVSELTP